MRKPTPLIKISDQIYAKLESVNPSGSIKDRMAEYILDEAEKKGLLHKGQTIVEATSGNTGIAFSLLAKQRGYKMIVVMPSNMSEERKKMIKEYGATIVEVGPGDFLGAVEKRNDLLKELNGFNPDQFANPDNRTCHASTTAQEILEQTQGKPITAFVAGVGTGGTLMGVHDGLKKRFPQVQIVGVEPSESAVMSGGKGGLHNIQGIGDGFIPELVDMSLIDHIITVSSAEAIARCKKIAEEQGVSVGISSGANVVAAEKYIAQYHPQDLVITVLPDDQNRYKSILNEK